MSNILQKIQSQLNAPKNQYNNFGKYHYRSCEDILNALKPLLREHGASIVISDEIICIGERNYVKATATLYFGEKNISASSFAREPLNRKGMDESQITGATSSYARKYALNGLFAIDDAKDPDTTNNGSTDQKTPSKEENIKTPESINTREELSSPAKDKFECPDKDGQLVAKIYCEKMCDHKQGCPAWEEQ
jgi:hypothetical protein